MPNIHLRQIALFTLRLSLAPSFVPPSLTLSGVRVDLLGSAQAASQPYIQRARSACRCFHHLPCLHYTEDGGRLHLPLGCPLQTQQGGREGKLEGEQERDKNRGNGRDRERKKCMKERAREGIGREGEEWEVQNREREVKGMTKGEEWEEGGEGETMGEKGKEKKRSKWDTEKDTYRRGQRVSWSYYKQKNSLYSTKGLAIAALLLFRGQLLAWISRSKLDLDRHRILLDTKAEAKISKH